MKGLADRTALVTGAGSGIGRASADRFTGAVAFRCSEDASYIIGHTIPVDGGQAAD